MKTKHILALALCLALVLCGCSANTAGEGASDQHFTMPGKGQLSAAESITSVSPEVLADRKLIRRISISAETEDMDALLSGLSTHIAALGGYVQSRNIHNGSAYSGSRYRSATLVIRIPAQQLDSFTQQVGQYSNIVSTSETSDDVTLEYVDTQSRLKMLRTEEERLLKFLADAASVSEMLEVEKRLTQVQSDIESLTAQLNTYDNLVSYGTVTLNITEVAVFTPAEEPGLWQKVRTAFDSSLMGLAALLQGLLVFLLGYSPYLLFYALIAGTVLLLIWAISRRSKKKASQATGDPENPPANTP